MKLKDFDCIEYGPDGSVAVRTIDGACYTLADLKTAMFDERDKVDHEAKHDEGKLQLRLVPPQIIRDIAEIRMYGNAKYGDPDNWKTVEKWRYIDALFRHFLLYLEDPEGVDEESGIKHYKHMACNMAFICAMEVKEEGSVRQE